MIAYTTIPSDNDLAKGLVERWASAEDLTYASQYASGTRKQASLVARALLKALLNKITGSRCWQIQSQASGKPRALTTSGETGPEVSISHTKGFVACALSTEGTIGIDVERWEQRDFEKLSRYAFGPKEIEEVRLEGMAVFYRIWTLREAIAKAQGESIFKNFDGTDCACEDVFSDCGKWIRYSKNIPTDLSLSIAVLVNNLKDSPHDVVELALVHN